MLLLGKKKILYKEWLGNWLLNQKHYIKESTYANYSSIIYNHLIPDLGEYRLSQLSNQILQKFILDKYKTGRLDNSGGLSDKTIKDIVILIKITLKSAIKESHISSVDLDFSYPKVSSKDKLYILTKTEQRKMICYILKNKTSRNLGILIALYSGLRIGELCALKWKDVNFKKNVLIVNKTLQRVYIKHADGINESKVIITTPKTKNANREIPMNTDFATILKEFKSKDDYYVLSCNARCIEPRTYRKHFDRLLKKIKVNHINFHSLRHTFASNCIRVGTDYKTVSVLLGHSTVNITLNLYVHPQMSQKKKCINLIYKDFQIKEP